MAELKDLLVKKLSDEFICIICMDPLFDYKTFHDSRSVLSCHNGCIHCEKCWNKHLETKKSCLTCREKVESIDSLSKNVILKKQFGNKKMKCPNIYNDKNELEESNGCKEILKIEEIYHHLEKCNSRYIECPFKDIGCESTFRYSDTDKHIEQCSYASVECPKCDKKVKKFEILKHQQEDCSKVTIKCKYADGGCKAEFNREELENHLKSIDHKEFIQNIIDQHKEKHEVIKRKYEDAENRLSSAEKKLVEFEQVTKKLKINCENLTSRLDSTEKFTFQWIIYNYSEKFRQYGNAQMFPSPAFYIGSYKFNLEIYLNGYRDYADFLSLFLFKKNHPESSVTAKYSFELVNRIPSKSVKYSNSSVFDRDLGFGYGSFRYYRKSEITEETGFVNDNKIIFNITVDISPPASSNVLITQ